MEKPKHMVIKLFKASGKEENLKNKLGRVNTLYSEAKMRMTHFLSEGIQLKRWWSNILKVFKEKYMNLSAYNSMLHGNIFQK